MTFLLASHEATLLRFLARRLPPWIKPNHLTGVGVLGALGTGLAYSASGLNPGWLWVASLMLAVNWFGDSLDGTLARVRRVERPRYGYYLDHFVDGFNTAVVGIGIGLSPYVHLEIAIGLVVVYLMLSINVYLESSVFGVFKMAYGPVGPTEGRIVLILTNTVGYFMLVDVGQTAQLMTNGVAVFLGIVMVSMLMTRFLSNLRHLAAAEPYRYPTRNAQRK